jgi:CHAD domain-containing protein
VGRLREHGAQPSDAIPKYVRALQPRASDAPDVGPRAVRKHASIAEVVGASLSASAARLIVSDPAVRLGEDPEGVHRARVATRRLRSDLRTFRSVLDAEWDTHLRSELGWLGDELGSVRDLDVLGERLRHHLAALGEDDAVAARKILDRLRVQRDEARAGLLSAIREDRYSALLDQVVSAAAHPAALPDIADTEASSLIGDLMDGPWGHLETACAGLGDDPLDEELHAARIRAKRVRYAAESLLPVAPKRARAFARRAATFQDVLGHHQDAVFAIGWLREQGSGTTSRVAFVAGRLAGVESDVQREARRAWPKAWKALRSDKVRFW